MKLKRSTNAEKERKRMIKRLMKLGYPRPEAESALACAEMIDPLCDEYGLTTHEAVKLAIVMAEGKSVLPTN